jgi:hypothetical protein
MRERRAAVTGPSQSTRADERPGKRDPALAPVNLRDRGTTNMHLDPPPPAKRRNTHAQQPTRVADGSIAEPLGVSRGASTKETAASGLGSLRGATVILRRMIPGARAPNPHIPLTATTRFLFRQANPRRLPGLVFWPLQVCGLGPRPVPGLCLGPRPQTQRLGACGVLCEDGSLRYCFGAALRTASRRPGPKTSAGSLWLWCCAPHGVQAIRHVAG